MMTPSTEACHATEATTAPRRATQTHVQVSSFDSIRSVKYMYDQRSKVILFCQITWHKSFCLNVHGKGQEDCCKVVTQSLR